MARNWTPDSWKGFSAAQQPDWPDSADLDRVLKEISGMPPLVFAGEARKLRASLGQVAAGNAFLLQAGDCAESFDEFSAVNIREKLRVILQMAVVLTYSMGVPVVKVGRIAGQFAKPRSSPFEKIGAEEIPSFRGHIVNDAAQTLDARRPDPARLLTAYNQSASTLNLLRAFTKGGFADLSRVHSWTQEFVGSSPEGQRYESIAAEIERALLFMRACGIDVESNPNLPRDLDGAHVEFLRGVGNPIGCKVGPSTSPDYLLELCAKLNPAQQPGRLTLISRMGADTVEDSLRPLLKAVKASGHPVVWACDPMHGNTITSTTGRKTRRFEDVMREIAGFVKAHHAEGTWPGGIHIELTGENVTECLGGADALSDTDLDHRYETMCDPRLNARQSLDLAFRVAELMRD